MVRSSGFLSQRKELLLGINSEAELVKQGTNANLRLLTYSDKLLKQESSTPTITSKDPDEYQKITTFSRNGDMVAVGSSKSQVRSAYVFQNAPKC